MLGLTWNLLIDNVKSLFLFKRLTLKQLHHAIERERERRRDWGRPRDRKTNKKDYYDNLSDKMKLAEVTSQKLIAVATRII